MNKIYVRIRGGLGNQLFQYAYAAALKEYNPSYEIILDKREFEKYYWPFELDKYKLDGSAQVFDGRKLKYDRSISFFHLYQYVYSKLTKKSYMTSSRLAKKGKLYTGVFSPEPRKYEDGRDLYLYGYFQDVDLIMPIRQKLIEQLSLKEYRAELNDYLSLIKEQSTAVSIRVARQEELKNGEKFVYDGKEYYLKCLAEIERRHGKQQVVVMSNDIDKIINEKWFADYEDDIVYVRDMTAGEQIEIFKKCRDFALANSTFSWWGAFLGAYGKDSVIIVPRIWYDGDRLEDTKLRFEGMMVDDEINV